MVRALYPEGLSCKESLEELVDNVARYRCQKYPSYWKHW